MNVCAYCRVSTDKDDQTNSFANQKQFFERSISQHPEWNFTEIYADEGITGTSTKKRTNFNRMIRDAQSGKIDLILTKEVSRFARNTVDTLKYTRELKAIDVRVIFLLDHIDTFEADGEFRLTIMASIAQEESRKTSERVKWGVQQQMKKGFVYAPSLLGYDVSKGVISVNRDEAKLVEEIFHKFAYENQTAYGIAREFTERGVKPVKRIKTWSATTILRILRNEKYVGDLLQRKSYVKDFLEHKCVKNTDMDSMIFASNHHEAIIDRETWDIVQSRLNIQKRKSGENTRPKASNKYWASGKIKCGLCGKNFSVKSKKLADGTKFLAWKCTNRSHFGERKTNPLGAEIGCDNVQVNNKVLEKCACFAYNELTQNCDFFLEAFKQELDISQIFSGNAESILVELEQKAEKLSEKKRKVVDMFLEGILSKQELETMKDEYSVQLRDVEKEMSLIKKSLQSDLSPTEQRIADIRKNMDRIIKNGTYRNEFLFNKLIEYIVAYPQKLEFHFYNIPFPITVKYETKGRGSTYKVRCEIA